MKKPTILYIPDEGEVWISTHFTKQDIHKIIDLDCNMFIWDDKIDSPLELSEQTYTQDFIITDYHGVNKKTMIEEKKYPEFECAIIHQYTVINPITIIYIKEHD